MLTQLEKLFERYTKRLTSGSHAAFSSVQREWQETAEKYQLDFSSVYPSSYNNHLLVLTTSSLEEAGRVRLLKKSILMDINKRLGGEKVHDISFITQ